jgi:hypothetical protein
MGGPDAGASEPGQARRAWLERLQRATQRARDELGDPTDPIVKDLTANLEIFAARLQRELEEPDLAKSEESGIT